MPRIAIVRGAYDPAGGAERFVHRMISSLAARGLDVTLIARRWRDGAGSGLPDGVRLIELAPLRVGRTWRAAAFAKAVLDTVARERFDLVQSHERIPGLPVYRAGDGVHREWLLQRQRKRGRLRSLADHFSSAHGAILRAETSMFTHAALRCVVCNSQMVRSEIQKHYGTDPAKLVVIRNGLDLARFSPPSAAQRGEARAQLGWPDGKTVFLFVGSGFERKGVDMAVRAFARANTRGDSLLAVVGRDKHLHRYQRLAASLGQGDAVRFMGPQQAVLPFYQAADAFVLPTLYDPQSNAMLEAMAIGLPVVSSTACGTAELLAADAGYVIDALDEAGWAEAMAALRDPDRRLRMGERARAAVQPYSLDRMTNEYLALYARLLAGQAPQAT